MKFPFSLWLVGCAWLALAAAPARAARIKDITLIEGGRDNQLAGYGLVVGLAGDGDSSSNFSTLHVIQNILQRAGVTAADVAALGIANQRETTVIWDRQTGRPIHNAIVWQDTRTASLVRELAGDMGLDRLRERSGLPLSTYFSGPKIGWLLEHVDELFLEGGGGAGSPAQAGGPPHYNSKRCESESSTSAASSCWRFRWRW